VRGRIVAGGLARVRTTGGGRSAAGRAICTRSIVSRATRGAARDIDAYVPRGAAGELWDDVLAGSKAPATHGGNRRRDCGHWGNDLHTQGTRLRMDRTQRCRNGIPAADVERFSAHHSPPPVVRGRTGQRPAVGRSMERDRLQNVPTAQPFPFDLRTARGGLRAALPGGMVLAHGRLPHLSIPRLEAVERVGLDVARAAA